jgi:predicted N-formylglutamate amidohydrolase
MSNSQSETRQAYDFIPGRPDSRILLVCDHASSFIPPSLGALGLAEADLRSHIAWDIGAASLTVLLAEKLGATAIMAGASRLVVDCNRAPHTCGWMPDISCGIPVPGNLGLNDVEIANRVAHWYDPYHQAIAEASNRLPEPCIIALHSFTPCLANQARPWHVGILWNQDGRMAVPLIESFSRFDDVHVGDNQPYSGQLLNYTLDRHAAANNLPHVSIEVRQDLIGEDAGAKRWAELTFQALEPILTDLGL